MAQIFLFDRHFFNNDLSSDPLPKIIAPFSESIEDSTEVHGLLYEVPGQGSFHLRSSQKQQLFHAGSSEEVSI